MPKYHFSLKFQLDSDTFPSGIMDALFDSDSSDSTTEKDRCGFLGVEFHKEAPNQAEAIETAIADVRQTFPNAKLVETNKIEEES